MPVADPPGDGAAVGGTGGAGISEARRLVEEIWRDAVAELDPAVRVAGGLQDIEKPTHLLAVGKAAAAMARGALEAIGPVPGLVVGGEGAGVEGLPSVVGDHPLPEAGSLEAGRRALDLCRSLEARDHLVVLLSGGASALMELPVAGVTIAQLREATSALMAAGASIEELNTVRTHLSVFKGGGLARMAAPASVSTLALSDVVGDSPQVIGSGPTVAAATTGADALQVLDHYGVAVPERVGRALRSAPDKTGWVGGQFLIVGNMVGVAQAAAGAAESRGFTASILTDTLRGEAGKAAVWAVRETRASAAEIAILAGETTVVVSGNGSGGRNQQAAVAAAIEIAGSGDIVFLAADTDGIDGPTEAAGGIVDGGSVSRAGSLEWARQVLERNDSAGWLRRAGDQLVTGPTGTNVGDLWVVWAEPEGRERR